MARRGNWRSLILCAGVVFALSAIVYAAQSDQRRVIHGKDNPELIPREVAWEHFFWYVVQDVFVDDNGRQYDEPLPDVLEGYARFTLVIPVADAAVVATVARTALEGVDAIRQPLTDEHNGKIHLSWSLEQRQAQVAKSYQQVLDSRDELQRRLSAPSFRRLERYVQEKIVPSMVYIP